MLKIIKEHKVRVISIILIIVIAFAAQYLYHFSGA